MPRPKPANENGSDIECRLARVEAALDRLEQLQAAQRLADVLDTRQRVQSRLSEAELDGIASRVFQKLRVNVLRVFALTRADDSQPTAAPVESRPVDPAAVERVLAGRRRKGMM